MRRIHRGPMNSPQKWPVTRKKFPFDDVIMHTELQAKQDKATVGSRYNAAQYNSTQDYNDSGNNYIRFCTRKNTP